MTRYGRLNLKSSIEVDIRSVCKRMVLVLVPLADRMASLRRMLRESHFPGLRPQKSGRKGPETVDMRNGLDDDLWR